MENGKRKVLAGLVILPTAIGLGVAASLLRDKSDNIMDREGYCSENHGYCFDKDDIIKLSDLSLYHGLYQSINSALIGGSSAISKHIGRSFFNTQDKIEVLLLNIISSAIFLAYIAIEVAGYVPKYKDKVNQICDTDCVKEVLPGLIEKEALFFLLTGILISSASYIVGYNVTPKYRAPDRQRPLRGIADYIGEVGEVRAGEAIELQEVVTGDQETPQMELQDTNIIPRIFITEENQQLTQVSYV